MEVMDGVTSQGYCALLRVGNKTADEDEDDNWYGVEGMGVSPSCSPG